MGTRHWGNYQAPVQTPKTKSISLEREFELGLHCYPVGDPPPGQIRLTKSILIA